MTVDRIEREIIIAAQLDRVWAVVTPRRSSWVLGSEMADRWR
jgi:hypothetical protein